MFTTPLIRWRQISRQHRNFRISRRRLLDTVAYGLFQQFQQKQYEMQQKSMQGQDFTDDEVKSLQELGDKMRDIQPIQNLMAKEQGLSQMMDELNKIISQPIIDVYQGK